VQSRDVFRQVRPDSQLGLFNGSEKQPGADVIFASIQTLSNWVGDFAPDEFDYIVIDEFHHAAALSYRAVLDHFTPSFMLGLTATPDRLDGADLLPLCGDNIVFDCDLVEGIARGQLVPFRYEGHRDVADFADIPWRQGRFDPEELARAVETRARAEQSVEIWRDAAEDGADSGAGSTLAFCCSISHAEFLADYFTQAGIPSVAVHSRPGSAPRTGSVEALRAGVVRIIFTVDVFNEGVDIPEVETVMMLRPTDSPVVFLQQLGRGLRRSPGKNHLRVIDFVGNHKSFLSKPRILVSMASGSAAKLSQKQMVESLRSGAFNLPAGCSVAYDLEAIDLLEQLVAAGSGRVGARNVLGDFCQEYAEANGYRPSALQALRSGYNPASVRHRGASADGGPAHWFGLLSELGLLSEGEQRVVDEYGHLLARFEAEPSNKSYKFVTFLAMVHDGTLRTGEEISTLAASAHTIVKKDPRLLQEAVAKDRPDPGVLNSEQWERLWVEMPIKHLVGGRTSANLFKIDGTRIVPTFSISEDVGGTFDRMISELSDWKIAVHLLKTESRTSNSGNSFRLKLIHNSQGPIITFNRNEDPGLPEGWTEVSAGGATYEMHFVTMAVNTARRDGSKGNALPALLRGWFGPDAGQPGTRQSVLLELGEDGWTMRMDD
jgi:hypothetical protein